MGRTMVLYNRLVVLVSMFFLISALTQSDAIRMGHVPFSSHHRGQRTGNSHDVLHGGFPVSSLYQHSVT